jgi:hypothetical protein
MALALCAGMAVVAAAVGVARVAAVVAAADGVARGVVAAEAAVIAAAVDRGLPLIVH